MVSGNKGDYFNTPETTDFNDITVGGAHLFFTSVTRITNTDSPYIISAGELVYADVTDGAVTIVLPQYDTEERDLYGLRQLGAGNTLSVDRRTTEGVPGTVTTPFAVNFGDAGRGRVITYRFISGAFQAELRGDVYVMAGDFGVGANSTVYDDTIDNWSVFSASLASGMYGVSNTPPGRPSWLPSGGLALLQMPYASSLKMAILQCANRLFSCQTNASGVVAGSDREYQSVTSFSSPVGYAVDEKKWSNDRIAEARIEITKHLNGESDAQNSPADYMSWIQALIAYRDGQSATEDDPATGTRPTLSATQKTFTIAAAGNADVLTVPAGIKSLDIDFVLTSGTKHRRHNITVLEKESAAWVWVTTLLLGDTVVIGISISASGVINITNNEAASLDLTIRKLG